MIKRSEIQRGDIVTAVFAPVRTDDLTPEARSIMGQRLTWTADYQVDEGFNYEGDWHMTLNYDDWKRTSVFWAPLCDLDQIERVE